MGFNDTYNAIMAMHGHDETTIFLKSMAAQTMMMKRRSCGQGGGALKTRMERKLLYYWQTYGPKEK